MVCLSSSIGRLAAIELIALNADLTQNARGAVNAVDRLSAGEFNRQVGSSCEVSTLISLLRQGARAIYERRNSCDDDNHLKPKTFFFVQNV